MAIRNLILFTFLMCSTIIYGQTTIENDSIVYKTTTIKDYRIEKLDKIYTESYELNGYRIQIFSGNKNQPAKQARMTFAQKYKPINAYKTYQQPFFKVRVGDFRTKLEALKFQKTIIEYYPNCFIVKDKIDFEALAD